MSNNKIRRKKNQFYKKKVKGKKNLCQPRLSRLIKN
jgi:hypothetical protein